MYSYNSFLEEHLLERVWILVHKNEEIFKDFIIESSLYVLISLYRWVAVPR